MVFHFTTFALTSSDLERSNQGQAYFTSRPIYVHDCEVTMAAPSECKGFI